MLDIKRIREDFDGVKKAVESRGKGDFGIDKVREYDLRRREILATVEQMKNEQKTKSKQIPILKKNGEDTTELMAEMKKLWNDEYDYDPSMKEYDSFDGWWGDTPGYHQHLSYASLRAIETRRSIARSANTGISALINQRGEILEQTEWWKPAYINGSLNLNNRQTVFVKYGDITGRIAKFLFYLFVLMAISRFISKKYIVKEPFAG